MEALAGLNLAALDAPELARVVREMSDDELALLGTDPIRMFVFAEVFARMSQRFRPERAKGRDGVVHWRISGGSAGRVDCYEVVMRDRACLVNQPPEHDATVVLEIAPVDFLRLVSGTVTGRRLVLRRRLRLIGDRRFARRLKKLFDLPK